MDFYSIILKIGNKEYPIDDNHLFITNILDDIEDFITVLDLEIDFRNIVSKFITENMIDSISIDELQILIDRLNDDFQSEFRSLLEEHDFLYEALFKKGIREKNNQTIQLRVIVDLLLTSKFRLLGQQSKSKIYDAIEQDNLHLFKAFFSNLNESQFEMVYHESFLQLAIMFQSKNIVEFLLNAGFSTNEINQTGNTATHYALKYGDTQIIELFESQKADFKVSNTLKEIALDFSFMNEDFEALQHLCKNGYYDNFIFFGNSRFANALNNNSKIFQLIRLLLDRGVVKVQDKFLEQTSFLAAILMSDKLDMIEYVLSEYCDIESNVYIGNTPLNFAVCSDKMDLVKFLLEKGAKVNSFSDSGRSVIRNSVSWSNFEMFKMLIQYGADVSLDDKMIVANAIRHKKIDVLKYMVENGFNLNQKLGNYTTLQNAITCQDYDIINYVIEHSDVDYYNQKNTPILIDATSKLNEKVILQLLDLGYDPNINFDKHSPLTNAINRNLSNDLIKGLISSGANLDFRDSFKRYPVHLAIIKNNLDVVKLIKEHGGKINTKMNLFFNSIKLAKKNGYTEIEEFLRNDLNSKQIK